MCDYIMGYESWSPEGSRKKGKGHHLLNASFVPWACFISFNLNQKKPREPKMIPV